MISYVQNQTTDQPDEFYRSIVGYDRMFYKNNSAVSGVIYSLQSRLK